MKTDKIKSALFVWALLLAGSFSSGCDEQENIEIPSFRAAPKKATVKVGEKASFYFTGSADIIAFYSGEVGYEYAHKDQDRILPAQTIMSFSTTTTSGTPGHPNPAYASVQYSTDFSGVYDETSIRAAHWQELSDQFRFPDDVGLTVASGELEIDDIFPDDGPIYLLFHYAVEAYDATAAGGLGNGRTQVTINNFSIKGVNDSGTTTLYDIFSVGWNLVLAANYEGQKSVPLMPAPPSTARILFRSDWNTPTACECWTVSGPLYKADDINLGPDKSIGIKTASDPQMTSYEYVYTKPGTYTVSFVGVNVNVHGREESVSTFEITVVEDSGEIVQPEPENN